jgi:hypothetical protein
MKKLLKILIATLAILAIGITALAASPVSLQRSGTYTYVGNLWDTFGIGTTSPWAKLSTHLNSNEPFKQFAFLIGSSTPSATSTLFSVDNTGKAIVGGNILAGGNSANDFTIGGSGVRQILLYPSSGWNVGVGGTMNPITDNGYDLGTNFYAWRNLVLNQNGMVQWQLSNSSTRDTGLARYAAGVVAATNAGTGGGSFRGDYFTATSTTATSTFAGYVMIGSSTPMSGNGMFGIATSSSALFWSVFVNKVTGAVSFGTSSPTNASTAFFTVQPKGPPPEPGDFPAVTPPIIQLIGAPAQVAEGTGSQFGFTAGGTAGAINIRTSPGGTVNNTSGVSMLFGGGGGEIAITSGEGGTTVAPNAIANIGGNGGRLAFRSGNGGGSATGSVRTAGAGGTFDFTSGAGGGGFSTMRGGNGGLMSFAGGAGGLGTTTGGTGGSFDLRSGAGGDGFGGTGGAAGNISIRSGLGGGTTGTVTGAAAGFLRLNGVSSGVGGNGTTGNGGAGSTVEISSGRGGNSTAGGNAGLAGNLTLLAENPGTGANVPAGGSIFLRPGVGSVPGMISLGCGTTTSVPMACVGNVAVGTTSAFAKLAVQNFFGSTTPLFDIATTTSALFATSSVFRINHDGNVGLGTTSPYARVSVVSPNNAPGIVTNAIHATSTTATSTFAGEVALLKPVKLAAYTVATLPTCDANSRGYVAYVTDALAPTFLVAITGGGAVVVPVFCDGTSWVAD